VNQVLPLDQRCTNTEPGADRGPRAGSPRGVVVRPGARFDMLNFDSKVVESLKPVDLFRSMLTAAMPGPGRYSSRFRICAAFVEWYCLIRSQRL